ncbi:helix-turn-helix domain-containing protein [Phaeobacter sp. QD34_3]|uniref:helix-turn-helix domain-containing protein n=1 Tax=unclassified Phaeobacter TaxID=2621772 RepID=UPI00237FB3EF|nr:MULTISPECIES: helix-turn-helix domain-containing protein [unclassified Phaeobacter]MDE4132466.1 helix-turn-helix domain-containing protein [Phaeobacter sp. QD34_3]MDE4136103.1 helix-turn-helix domain-containing protein [Phaeobacter sp. QD34_24]MDE4175891.1 helix-turn-helix domain-containing protein [Phaeobacter sp. PT47_59]
MTPSVAHIEKVLEVANSPSAAARSRLAASWRRSAEKHGLDPGEHRSPKRVEGTHLRERLDAFEKFMTVAAPRMDCLFSLIGQSGCAVLLTDDDGVVLDQRISEADTAVFQEWGLSIGADWSEQNEGTNGIGTCLAEQRRVIIHRDEHFFARNTAMSCIDAPIYGADGRIMAALDVSSARADHTEAFNRLIGAQVAQTARAIEEANFRAAFDKARIVVAESDNAEASTLLAIDEHDLIIGATREARRVFRFAPVGDLAPRPANDVLGRRDGPTGFEKAERAAVIRALTRSGGNVSEAARHLGIGRATLYRRMKRLGLDQG